MKGVLAPGRGLRGVLAWLAASIAAGIAATILTIAFLIARESVLHAPFPASQWWIFLHLWRPMIIGALVLIPLAGALPAALFVQLVRRRAWPRPQADMIAGAAAGLLAVAFVVALVRLLGVGAGA